MEPVFRLPGVLAGLAPHGLPAGVSQAAGGERPADARLLGGRKLGKWRAVPDERTDTWSARNQVDGIVPITGTLSWIASMDLPVSKPWKPWTTSRGQVGGYRVEYGSRFAFQSVRGAGHMVPYTQVSTCGRCAGTGRGLTKKTAPPRRGDVRRVPRRGRRGNVNVNGWRPGHGGCLSRCAIDGGGTIFRR